MIILILWKWPGAILTFFCLILSLAVNTTYASPAQVDANGLVTLDLAGNAPPPLQQSVASSPPKYLRLRDPGKVEDLLGGLLGANGKKGATPAPAVTKVVTVTRSNNVTVQNVVTATVMMSMTMLETVTATVTAMAPPAMNPQPNVAVPTPTPAGGSVLTLGFLSSAKPAATMPAAMAPMAAVAPMAADLAGQQEEIVTEMTPTQEVAQPTSTVFAIATQTMTSTLELPDETLPTMVPGGGGSLNRADVMKAEAVSEAISRRHGKSSLNPFAVVVAVAVAVVIL